MRHHATSYYTTTVPPPALTGKAIRRLPTLDQAVREWNGGRLGRA
jgi:hypothetical protein